MSAIAEFTKNIVEMNCDALPAEVMEATKKQILDTLGVAVAGSMSKDVKQLVDVVKDWGGKGESTLLGYGGKVPCTQAALINGWSGGVLDFDDFHDRDYIHASREVVPAALAIAERKGAVSGKDFMVAVALGFDLACRMARSALVHRESGYLCAPSSFGAAAAGGKLLGFDEETLRNALGIALMQVCGEGYGIHEVLNTKGLDFGFQGHGGVFAVIMAERGLSGIPDPIEGERFGFFAANHRGLYTPALLTVDLGKVFEVTTVSQKPYPCCRFNHTAIKAALALVNENDIEPDDIAEVVVQLGPIAISLGEPLEDKRKPRSAIHTQHNIPWSIANAIVYRKIGIEHFTEEAIRDPRALEMAQKVVTKLNPNLSHIPVAEPAIVEIKIKSGEVYSKRVDAAPGSPEDPMSFDDIVRKFRDCCEYSSEPVSEKNQDEVIQMVQKLEDVTDVGQITCLLG